MFKKAADLLEYLEKKGISVANFAKQSGVSANRLHLWKAGRGNPKGEDAVLIQKWYEEHVVNDIEVKKEVHTKESNSTEKETDLHGLIRVTEIFADAHLGLVRSHEILNQNHKTALAQNDELIKLAVKEKVSVKINSDSAPSNLLINETFVRLLSESLAKKYSWNESEIRKEIGNTLHAFQATMKSSGIQKNAQNEGN